MVPTLDPTRPPSSLLRPPMGRNPLQDACIEIMKDPEVHNRYPLGLSAHDVLMELREREPGAFPLCSVIDVADELRDYYGAP